MNIVIFLLSIVLAGIVDSTFAAEIMAPSTLSVHDDVPDIELLLGEEDLPSINLFVWLNGRDVTEKLAKGDGKTRYLYGDDISPFIKHHENQIVLLTAESGVGELFVESALRFVVDDGAPEVAIITTPKMSDDNILLLSVSDPLGVSNVSVNGVAAGQDYENDNYYAVALDSSSQLEIVTTDIEGEHHVVTYISDDGVLGNTISATVSNSNLLPIEELVKDIIINQNVMDYIENPVYVGNPTDIEGQLALTMKNLSYGIPDIRLASKNGILKMTAIIPDVNFEFNGTATFCLLVCIEEKIKGEATLSKAVVRANVSLPITNGKVNVKLERFRTKTSAPTVTLTGGKFKDILIVEGIVNDISKTILPSAFQRALKKPIKKVMKVGFRKLDLSLEGDVLGVANVKSVLLPTEMRAVKGGVAIRSGLDTTFSNAYDDNGLGFRYSGKVPPLLDVSTGTSAAISVDVINQLAWKAMRAGLLTMDYCANTAADIPGIFGADYKVSIDPVDAPYVELGRASDAMMSLRLASLPVTIEAYIELWGEKHLVGELKTYVDMQADVSLQVVNNRVQLDIIGLPIVNANIDQGKQFKLFKGLVELTEKERVNLSNLLSFEIIKVMPGYVSAIESVLSIAKLPTLEGLSIAPDSFYALDEALVMTGELVPSVGSNVVSFPMPPYIQSGIDYCEELP